MSCEYIYIKDFLHINHSTSSCKSWMKKQRLIVYLYTFLLIYFLWSPLSPNWPSKCFDDRYKVLIFFLCLKETNWSFWWIYLKGQVGFVRNGEKLWTNPWQEDNLWALLAGKWTMIPLLVSFISLTLSKNSTCNPSLSKCLIWPSMVDLHPYLESKTLVGL